MHQLYASHLYDIYDAEQDTLSLAGDIVSGQDMCFQEATALSDVRYPVQEALSTL